MRAAILAVALSAIAMYQPSPSSACIATDVEPWSPETMPSDVVIGRVISRNPPPDYWQIEIEQAFLVESLTSPFTLAHAGNCSFNVVAQSLDPGARILVFALGPATENRISSMGALVWLVDAQGSPVEGPTGVDGITLPTLQDLLLHVPNAATHARPTPGMPSWPLLVACVTILFGIGFGRRFLLRHST